MDFHRRQWSKLAGEFLGFQGKRFIGRFATNQLRRETGHSDCRFTAEGLERRTINDLFAILFFELHPKPQHLTAIGVANRAHGIGIGQFAHVLGIRERRLDSLF
jgi:hypothetical protein